MRYGVLALQYLPVEGESPVAVVFPIEYHKSNVIYVKNYKEYGKSTY